MDIEFMLTFLKQVGLLGLFLAMFIEGSSIPFPGIIVVLAYGYAMNQSLEQLVIISILMSIVYTLASFIPYMLAEKSERMIKKRFRRKLDRAQDWFRRYGMWSICLSRPFSVGNYISYAAGMSKVPKVKYFVYTFLGIFPWSLAVLVMGNEIRWIF